LILKKVYEIPRKQLNIDKIINISRNSFSMDQKIINDSYRKAIEDRSLVKNSRNTPSFKSERKPMDRIFRKSNSNILSKDSNEFEKTTMNSKGKSLALLLI
jgi:hypothetical protein